MKKSIFCVFLALLALISSVAFAENTGCCACCSADGCTSADSASTAYIPKYDNADYTLEVVHDGFRLFLPSSFEDNFNNQHFKPANGAKYPDIAMGCIDGPTWDLDFLHLSHDELREHLETLIANNPEYSVIQLDECLGLMSCEQHEYIYVVTLDVTNREKTLHISIRADSSDEALELLQGIIDHAVAKEIPLDELEQDL